MSATNYQIVLNVTEQIAEDVYRLASAAGETERVFITFGDARGDIEINEVVSTQVIGTT